MNLCAFSRPNGYFKSIPSKVYQRSQFEEILSQFYLPNAKLEFDSHDTSNEWLSVGITSVQGWRTQQEDAHLCNLQFENDSQLALLGVFDGHNGHEVSQYAAKMLPQYIKNNANFFNQQYVSTLQESFLQFDGSLLGKSSNEDLESIRSQAESYDGTRRSRQTPLVALNAGCTAVVALLAKNGPFYVANIGDSRCVLCVRGKPVPLSKDHKPTDDAERQRIERAGCHVVNGRINQGLNLSRAFGDHLLKNNNRLPPAQQAVSAFPDVTVTKEKIKQSDFMVIACDGVWNCMTNKEVCAFVRKHIKRNGQLSKICEELVKRCVSPVRPLNGQIGGDNMTCIIVRFDRDIP